jgi:hypothetical protein
MNGFIVNWFFVILSAAPGPAPAPVVVGFQDLAACETARQDFITRAGKSTWNAMGCYSTGKPVEKKVNML